MSRTPFAPVFRLPLRHALIVTALGLALVAAFLLVMLDLVNHLVSGEPFSVVAWLLGNLALLLVFMVVVAVLITAVTWGYWLGDLGDRRGDDRSDEARAALEVLERKYANKEVTMTEYLALRKGIDRDRPRY